jgi:predicted GH43/DUF377 family glycosyl hydrolase
MVRYEGNPIIKPIKDHPWESKFVFNTAMISLGNRIHYFYRAMGEDMVSRLGYASSKDGFNIDIRLPNPVFEPLCSLEKYGCEDPRMTLVGDTIFMTYTAYGDIFQVGITSISSEDLVDMKWSWGKRIFPFPDIWNKNAVIFPRIIKNRYVMLHRHEPDICVAYSNDLCNWNHSGIIMKPRPYNWDSFKIGSAGPPMEVDEGWLLIYHGVDDSRTYRLGATILDKTNPTKVLGRTKDPILEPCEEYEKFGQVPNVVFSCGSVIQNKKLLISYGGADTVIGVASYALSEIIDQCV